MGKLVRQINNIRIEQGSAKDKFNIVFPDKEVFVMHDVSMEYAVDICSRNRNFLNRKTNFKKLDDKAVQKIWEFLGKIDFYATDVGLTRDGILYIDIEWGDWKHSHRYIDYTIEKNFNLECIDEEVTEEDGSDCYSAIHYYKLVGVNNDKK